MNTMSDVKKKDQEWKIEVSTENDTITLVLIDKNDNRVSRKVPSS